MFYKGTSTLDFHPLNYQQLKIAQEKDKTIPNILQMENTKYVRKDYHGGGKATSFKRCHNDKIVIQHLLQKHMIMWYHSTLCHPGIFQTEKTFGQHLWWPK
jgi:hypothetical protein